MRSLQKGSSTPWVDARLNTHTHRQERPHKCCTYPLSIYPLESAREMLWTSNLLCFPGLRDFHPYRRGIPEFASRAHRRCIRCVASRLVQLALVRLMFVSERWKGADLIRGCFPKSKSRGSVVPRNIGNYSIQRGLFSNFHLVVSVVLVVSSWKTNNPLPKQPPFQRSGCSIAIHVELRIGLRELTSFAEH